jgi:hypothetical protein
MGGNRMNKEYKDKILEVYGHPGLTNKEGTKTIVFARQSNKDVEYIEGLSDEKLIEEWKSYVWSNCIYGCVSLGDLQRIDLMEAEFSSRPTIMARHDELNEWFDKAKEEFEKHEGEYNDHNGNG